MKVLLTNDVNKLGLLGDVVDVADGYARNYLLPQGLAKPATDANIKAIAKAKSQRAEQRHLERQQMERAAQAVDGAEAVIAATANEQGHLFGSVFKHEIAENLRAQGFEVPDDVVALDEHIKQVGTYNVKLRFEDDLKVAVTLVVVPEGADVEAFKAAQKEAAKKPAEQPVEEKEQTGDDEKTG
ncbi:MAG: 50S ribosomal protein L9 [Planctomycetota bacterium]